MHIFLAQLSHLTAARRFTFEGLLSDTEMARYLRFTRHERAQQFLVGRGLLRQALAPYLNITPEQVILREQENQAPALENTSIHSLSFSISHSRDWVACCVSTEGKVGLDIEVIDPTRSILEIARHSLSATQNAALHLLPAVEQVSYFYRCWVAQEAQVKLAVGCQDIRHADHPNLAIAVCSEVVLSMPLDVQYLSLK